MFKLSSPFSPFLLLITATLVFAGNSHAATVLTLSSWMPPEHANVADAIVPWADAVEEATDGRVKINVMLSPLGPPKEHFDMVADGVVDIAYGVQGYQPGRFVTAEVAELPFLGDKAEVMSIAYWRTFDKYLREAGEYDSVEVLSVYTHGPGQLFNNVRPIRSLEDLRGIRVRLGGGAINRTAELLNIDGTHRPANEVYSLLSSGVLEGTVFPAETVKSYNLGKHVEYATIVPGGFYNVSWFLVMNEEKFNSLSQEDQAAIKELSGEHFARRAGAAWDAADERGIEYLEEIGIDTEYASPELVDAMVERTKSVEQEWIEKANDIGLDGQEIMAYFREQLESVDANK